MTFRIANNQIHVDWKVALASVSLIISTTWGAAWFVRSSYDEYIQNQEKTNAALKAIQNDLSMKRATDSIQTKDIVRIAYKIDSIVIAGIPSSLHRINNRVQKFYTERWVNGRLVLTEVKSPTNNN